MLSILKDKSGLRKWLFKGIVIKCDQFSDCVGFMLALADAGGNTVSKRNVSS